MLMGKDTAKSTANRSGGDDHRESQGIFINGCVDCRYRGDVCFLGGGENDTDDEGDD
jgi:hypothetical protein